jgi:hypothetical protein
MLRIRTHKIKATNRKGLKLLFIKKRQKIDKLVVFKKVATFDLGVVLAYLDPLFYP